jgi:hypothetical protein
MDPRRAGVFLMRAPIEAIDAVIGGSSSWKSCPNGAESGEICRDRFLIWRYSKAPNGRKKEQQHAHIEGTHDRRVRNGRLLAFVQVKAGEQIRVYDSRGNSIGTARPESGGTIRYRDSRGNSMGTSTTMPGGTTTFYGPGGGVTGKTVGPCPAGSLACGVRR